MFDKFQKAVIEDYLNLKAAGKLPFESAEPSTGRLKEWCMQVYLNGLTTDDEHVFNQFFNPSNSAEKLERLIKNIDPDKFRPMRNYIIGATKARPDERLVKLLAVLIDFQPRPYRSSDWGAPTVLNPTDHPTDQNERFVIDEPKAPNRKTKLWYAAFAIVSVCLIIGLFFYPKPQQCMAWVEDQYIAMHCQDENAQVELIALDEKKLKSFHKITRPDTLSRQHRNKLWYSKINNQVEFFTAPGFHPIYKDRALKVATERIIVKYALPKEVQVTEALVSD